MLSYAVGKSSRLFARALAVCVLLAMSGAVQAHAQSVVGATICTEASSVTLDAPVSDSVVTAPTVPLQGTVSQASQIEVRIDGSFDSSIPLNIGQMSYNGSVQLTPGTHTIEVSAVNICPGPNDTASAVVTYSQPPQQSSQGSQTQTVVGNGQGATVNTATSSPLPQPGQPSWVSHTLNTVGQPLEATARWLNIDLGAGEQGQVAGGMPVGRTIGFTLGVVLVVSNLIPAALYTVATLPAVSGAVPAFDAVRRYRRFLLVGGRLAGALLILAALFL